MGDSSKNYEVPIGKVFENLSLKKAHYVVFFILLVTVVIDSMEATYVSLLLPAFEKYFSASHLSAATVLSIPFLAAIIGAVFWGNVSDYLGRKKMLVTAYFSYGVLNFIAAFSTSMSELLIFRTLAFFMFAGAVVISFPYLQEFMPTKIRGRMLNILLAATPVGVLIATEIAILVLPHFNWQGVFIVMSFLSLWGFVILFFMNESPYWLTKVGNLQKARKVIYEFASRDELIDTVGIDLENVVLTTEKSKKVPMSVVWSRKYIGVTIMVGIIAFTYAFGYWGIFAWIPGYLISRGVHYSVALEYEIIYALCAMPGYALSAYLMEKPKIGRKSVSIVFLVITALSTVAFLNVGTVLEAILALAVLSFFSNGIWGTLDAWFPEQYPTEARGAGNGWALAMERIAPATAPLFVGAFLSVSGGTSIITIVLFSMIVLAVIGSVFLKETRGVDLV